MTLVNDVAGMLDELLSEDGSSFTYSRGATSATVTLYKSEPLPLVIDDGSGMVSEVIGVEFRGRLSDFSTFGLPKNNDRITDGANYFQVLPKIGERCYHTLGGLVHIYAKQVAK